MNLAPFYRLKLEEPPTAPNPEQRIQQDIGDTVRDAVELTQTLVGNTVSFFAFTRMLLKISPRAFYGLVFYSVTGTVITLRVFSRHLVGA